VLLPIYFQDVNGHPTAGAALAAEQPVETSLLPLRRSGR
jgi:hypothetical protein